MGCKPPAGFDFYTFETDRFPQYVVIITDSARRSPIVSCPRLRSGFIFSIIPCQAQRLFDQRIGQLFIPAISDTCHRILRFILILIRDKQFGEDFVIYTDPFYLGPLGNFNGGILISGQCVRYRGVMVISSVLLDFVIKRNVIPVDCGILFDQIQFLLILGLELHIVMRGPNRILRNSRACSQSKVTQGVTHVFDRVRVFELASQHGHPVSDSIRLRCRRNFRHCGILFLTTPQK